MKTPFALLLLPLALLAAAPEERIDLLAATDLTGWTVYIGESSNDAPTAASPAIWSLQDGVLRLDGTPNVYLRTTRPFANYRLHVEWRWPNADVPSPNSGLVLHVNGPDRIWPDGYEVQLKGGLAGEIVAFRQDLPGGVPSPRDGFKRAKRAQPASEKPLGAWNVAEVICRGDSLEVLVNGVRQNLAENLPVTSGAIALQSEGFPIEFRHLTVEPL